MPHTRTIETDRHLAQWVSGAVGRDLLGMAVPQVWVPPPLVEGARALLAAAEQCGGHDMPCTIAPFEARHAPRTSLTTQTAHGRLHASDPSILKNLVVPNTTALFPEIAACLPLDNPQPTSLHRAGTSRLRGVADRAQRHCRARLPHPPSSGKPGALSHLPHPIRLSSTVAEMH